MDKSENSIRSLYSELFESEAPPALAVTRHRDSKGFDWAPGILNFFGRDFG